MSPGGREARAGRRKPRKEKQKGGRPTMSNEHRKKAVGFGSESRLLLMRDLVCASQGLLTVGGAMGQ